MKVVFLRGMFVALLFAALAAVAQEYRFELKTDKADALYQQNEPIVFSALVLADGKAVNGMKVDYLLRGDGNLTEKGSYVSSETAYEVKTSLGFPGWVQIRFSLFNADGTPVKTLNYRKQEVNLMAEIGAMVDPLKIQAAGEEPADFDAFWAAARAELDAVPLQAKKESSAVPEAYAGKMDCWDVKVDCAGGMPVSGYLVVPVGAAEKSLPAIVSYHGAGVRSANKPFGYAARGAIALDVNAHGIENGQPAEFYTQLSLNELKNYPHRDKEDPAKFYFRGMYLRVMRALDYVKSLPEWDGKNLIVTGGSQGGAQAIVAAGLDRQVTLCIAGVPALSEHSGPLAKPQRQAGWPRLYKADANGLPENPAVCKTAAYFDNIYFAKRIKAEAWFSTGFVDNTCVPTGVFAAFNNLPAGIVKEITTTPAGNHGAPNSKGNARLDLFFKNLKTKQ
ncbi:MAG: acetylxylan esterase [Lentisphaeria bacterium]|nr:acetylxylan esterase [Lentisphaeria bacterium]